MIKLTGLDGSTAWVNPMHVVAIVPVRDEGGVQMIGVCAVQLVTGNPVVARISSDELAESVKRATSSPDTWGRVSL